MTSVGAGGGLLLCVLSMPVGMMPKPMLGRVMLGRVMPGRLKLGKPNLLEAAARGPVAACDVDDVCAADGA
jgi:hypothetical protein